MGNLATKKNRTSRQTFFWVDWEGDFKAILSFWADLETCKLTSDGACVCSVSTSEEEVFFGLSPPKMEDVLRQLHIGAFETGMK